MVKENNPYALNLSINNNQLGKQKRPYKKKILFTKII